MELEEAKNKLQEMIGLCTEEPKHITYNEEQAIKVILNHLTKQEKMIELMVIELAEQYNHYEPCWLECEDNIKCDNQESCEECIKQYFKKKAEEIN